MNNENRIEMLKLLQEELSRYLKIFEKDYAENFKNNYFKTSIICHLEDIGLEIDSLEEEIQNDLS